MPRPDFAPGFTAKLARNIADARRIANVTQESLADACGVTKQTIYFVEKARRVPSLALFLAICEHLECSPEDLLPW